MIIDLLLLVLQGVLNIVLLPLTVINIGIDFLAGIPVFVSFLQVVAYVLPWPNILPLIVLSVGIIVFKTAISLIKTIWALIPFV